MVAKCLVAVCALALAACGGPTGTAPPSTTTTTATGFMTTDSTPPSTATTSATAGGRLTITIGTARLDGSTPNGSPWGERPPVFDLFTDEPTQLDCKAFAWRDQTSVPITVVGVAFSNGTVAHSSPAFDLCEQTGAEVDCRGHTFAPPNSDKPKCGVPVIARKPPGDRAMTTVTLTFRAACSSAAARPCDDARVVERGPSAAQPVFLEWTYSETLTTVWHPCTTEEHDDGCPSDETTTDPPETTAGTKTTTATSTS
ncbi:hypothetical protein SUDANB95_06419 [Actinosynnema sp. ALI-1.44]